MCEIISRTLNVMFCGSPYQCLCGRVYNNSKLGGAWLVAKIMLDFIFLWREKEHCRSTAMYDYLQQRERR